MTARIAVAWRTPVFAAGLAELALEALEMLSSSS
jgi:hypothetical protein